MTEPSSPAPAPPPSGLLHRLWEIFTSIKTGICLLVTLFFYGSLGSAGVLYPTENGWFNIQIRQLRGLEMTEFEWFHWWPFELLIGLICLTLVLTTWRRIPFRPVNYGVWMIHTGVIILCAGCVWYFSTKIEGDTPVLRRQVEIHLPWDESITLPALPGSFREVRDEGGSRWTFWVSGVDREWALASEEHLGKTAYSVKVQVTSPQERFTRQLLDGYPEFTEDIIASDDPMQPFARAKKVLGRALVDESLHVTLGYAPQEWGYLAHRIEKAWALYLRPWSPPGQTPLEWAMRPIEGLPLYNDYIGSRDKIWLPEGMDLPLDPLDLSVPSLEEGDPLHGQPVRVTGYLRYAQMEERVTPDRGGRLQPTATLRLAIEGLPPEIMKLAAFDPERSSSEEGLIHFRWVGSEEERDAMTSESTSTLSVACPEADYLWEGMPQSLAVDEETGEREFVSIPGTEYAWRVGQVQDHLQINEETIISLAMVEIRTPDRSWERWVSDNPAFTRDMPLDLLAHGAEKPEPLPLDEGLVMTYAPGAMRAPVTLLAGPHEDDLEVIVRRLEEAPMRMAARVGEAVTLRPGLDLTVDDLILRGRPEVRPAVIPNSRRDRNVDLENLASMVLVEIPGTGESRWVHYHTYPFKDGNDTLLRYPFNPTVVEVGGQFVEVILSRQRFRLPEPVALADFEIDSHLGGFTGRVSSIRDWISKVTFKEAGGWSSPMRVSMNKPAEHGELSYFQAQWDPPQPARGGIPASQGLNYTVLGLGNRHGVTLMLLGPILSVLGMLYAFYVKPVLMKRRRATATEGAS